MSVSCDAHPQPGQRVDGSAVAAKFEVESQTGSGSFGHAANRLADLDALPYGDVE